MNTNNHHPIMPIALVRDGFVKLAADQVATWVGKHAIEFASVKSTWSALPPDPYMPDGSTYRRRRIGKFELDLSTNTLTSRDDTSFEQSSEINSFVGDVARKFEPIAPEFANNPLTHELIRSIATRLPKSVHVRRWQVTLHQIRITAKHGESGQPTPEGVHRDGHAYVAQVFFGRTNAKGATSTIYDDDYNELISTELTDPLECIVVDDPEVLHSVTPLEPKDPAKPAVRDMLLIDFDQLAETTTLDKEAA